MLIVKVVIVNKVALIIKARYVNIALEPLIFQLIQYLGSILKYKKGTTEVVPLIML